MYHGDAGELVGGSVLRWTLLGRSAGASLLDLSMFIGGAYLIDSRHSVYFGLLLVGWSCARAAVRSVLGNLLSPSALLDTVAETRAASRLDLTLRIDAILEHPAVNAAFERLRALGRIPEATSMEQWRRDLVERFRKLRDLPAEEPARERVSFEFRSGQIWKNREFHYSSIISHEVLIEDEALKAGITNEYSGLTVRVVVVNGLLKVQVGEWEERVGYRAPGQTCEWIAWDTITSFPLLLNPRDHFIPPRFLWLDHFSGPRHRHDRKEARLLFYRAWAYRRVLSTFGYIGEQRLSEHQDRDFEAWLKREGYRRAFGRCWHNPYLMVTIESGQPDDYNAYRWLSDERW